MWRNVYGKQWRTTSASSQRSLFSNELWHWRISKNKKNKTNILKGLIHKKKFNFKFILQRIKYLKPWSYKEWFIMRPNILSFFFSCMYYAYKRSTCIERKKKYVWIQFFTVILKGAPYHIENIWAKLIIS